MPFFDFAGVLADDSEVDNALLRKAAELAEERKADTIELRQTYALSQMSFEFAAKGWARKVLTLVRIKRSITLPIHFTRTPSPGEVGAPLKMPST